VLVDQGQFETHGWVRVRGAFSADEAAAMRAVTWQALESVGIRRDDPSTWHEERPGHLQLLKGDPVFQAVGSHRAARNAKQAPSKIRAPAPVPPGPLLEW
jgi:hypothetical protein